MVIDKKEHQQFLLELIRQAQFPGAVLDLAHELKVAILTAEVKEPENDK